MAFHLTKLSAIGLAFTSLALFVAVINGAVAVVKLRRMGPRGRVSSRWIRAAALLVIVYLSLSLAAETYLLSNPLWTRRLGIITTVLELPEFAELFVILAQAAILVAQFELLFDLAVEKPGKAMRRAALALFAASQIFNITRFIAYHVALYGENDAGLYSDAPAYVYAVYIPAFLLEVVLFATAATSVVVVVRYWVDYGAKPNGTAHGLLFAASAFSLLRHTWTVITSGISQISALRGMPRLSIFPTWFFLVEMVLTHWNTVIVTTLLFCSASSGLRKRSPAEAVPMSEAEVPIELGAQTQGRLAR